MNASKSARHLSIGIINMVGPVPGANNVVDGLLRFQSCFSNVTLMRFKKGFESLVSGDCQEITMS